MKKILIIEDDENLSRGLIFTFEKEGYHVIHEKTLTSGKKQLDDSIDLLILDLNLPDGDGLCFCQELRKEFSLPVVMLTARDLEIDEVSGFAAGADDYITKPFSLSVLRARVDRLINRFEDKSKQIVIGTCVLDIDRHQFYKDNQLIKLSTTEFQLLKYLMINAGIVLTRNQMIEAIWDLQGSFVDENTLSVNISRIRSKIEEDPKHPKFIKSIRGIGYQFEKDVR